MTFFFGFAMVAILLGVSVATGCMFGDGLGFVRPVQEPGTEFARQRRRSRQFGVPCVKCPHANTSPPLAWAALQGDAAPDLRLERR
jgi:hypothetical protein